MKNWTYKNCDIKEGLKPGSSKFRYFYQIFQGGEKKCNYCIWILEDALSRFDTSKDFDTIISSQLESWNIWVKEKIDSKDFRDRALVFEKNRETEIDFSMMGQHVVLE